MPITVLIPALKPSGQLLSVIKALAVDDRVNRIILVNDGSPPECDVVFHEAANEPKVVVLRHILNLGKGAALRTGMNHFLCADISGSVLVTADADGQHLPVDILRVGERAMQTPGELVMGARGFSGNVPLRSRFGNNLTRGVYRTIMGPSLTDTQTGLRAIPRPLMESLLHVRINGYDFEMQMLVMAAHQRMTITQVPIQTVYIENNRDSHFNPLLDSIRIYYVFVRHLSVLLLSLLGDFLIFVWALAAGTGLGVAMLLGRVAVLGAHLIAGRILGWHVQPAWRNRMARQALFMTVQGILAYFCIGSLVNRFGWNPVAAKLLVESILVAGIVALQRNRAPSVPSSLVTATDAKVGDNAASVRSGAP